MKRRRNGHRAGAGAARPARPAAPEAPYAIAPLPVPRTAAPRTAFGLWLAGSEGGAAQDSGAASRAAQAARASRDAHATQPWHRVLWLTGVDYFSTLGYQPGIALLAAGALAPVATGVLIVVTLFCAVPVYGQVARRSYAGQGSVAMLEALFKGWYGKLFVLMLLGFAATDFVITMTLSAADAAEHAAENPLLHDYLGGHQIGLTLLMLGLLAAVFLKGFKEAIRVASAIAIPYLVLNLFVLLWGCWQIAQQPELITNWNGELRASGDWTMLLVAAVFLFPKLALGLSGFETGVSVMPHVAGDAADPPDGPPHGRIRSTRRLLLTAALIMSVMLVLSSFVTTLLVPPEAYAADGNAAGRVIAWLAHEMLGHGFGSVYDMCTIAILWFAGASAMAGLLAVLPRYLPRYGMAPRWTVHTRPLVLVLFAVSVIVTLVFRADVEAQAGAYATGVLVLMTSAAFAVSLALWREARAAGSALARQRGRVHSGYFWIVTGVFLFALGDNVAARPDGVVIASIFILAFVVIGGVSRYTRATELRVSTIHFASAKAADLWGAAAAASVNLVPLKGESAAARMEKVAELREHFRVDGPVAFLHVSQLDNRSEFLAPLVIDVRRDGDHYVIHVSGAIAIANTIAYVSELLAPRRLFLGLTGRDQMTESMRYLLLGEGEVGLLVYKILLRYWDWIGRKESERPLLFLFGDREVPAAPD